MLGLLEECDEAGTGGRGLATSLLRLGSHLRPDDAQACGDGRTLQFTAHVTLEGSWVGSSEDVV